MSESMRAQRKDKICKIYYLFITLLSFVDLLFGIISMCTESTVVQIMSLCFSLLTLAFLILGYIKDTCERRSKGTLIISSIDVLIGIISIVFMFNSLRVIFGLTSGATGLKVVRTIIQTEKFKKFFEVVKPRLLRIMSLVLPNVILNFIDKIKKNEKGVRTMKNIKKFFESFASMFKNNVFTISGSTVVAISAGLSSTWAVKHIMSTGLLPVWAAYVVGIAICLLVYGFIEFTVLKYGAEDQLHVNLRKGLKTILGIIGADEMVSKIDEIEKYALGVKEEEEKKAAEAAEAAKLQKEAEERLAKEEEENAKIMKEAEERLAKEEEERLAKEAEAKRLAEEEKERLEHEKKVQAMMAKLRNNK